MSIALPVWGSRISPVFDTARRLLLVNTQGRRVTGRSEAALAETVPQLRAAEVSRLGVRVLLCGAISRPLAEMLMSAGIRLHPFFTGEVEEVLSAYLAGKLDEPRFIMPGCGAHRGRFRGGRGRRGRGRQGGRRNA